MQKRCISTIVAAAIGMLLLTTAALQAADEPARTELKSNEAQGQLQVLIDGKEALVYCYGKDVGLTHYFPVRSPSGKPLTAAPKTNPYPHHCSLWFADTVQLEGQRKASFYNALYSGRADPKDAQSPPRDHIRHVEFVAMKAAGNRAEFSEKLLWEMDFKTPVLDEQRQVRMVALDQGQYFLDLSFTVTASYGDVNFVSDAIHYAWPYVRMSPEFSALKGGRITRGGANEKEAKGNGPRWVDYSNTIGGVTEGLAMFLYDPGPAPPKWLTRDYGTFGPRRMDSQNGKPFLVKKGESLKQRVGIFVHAGDAEKAQVGQRYQQYVDGKL